MDIRELIQLSKLEGPEEAALFERFRRKAFEEAANTFSDRAISYNVDHVPTEEMPYGIVSLASEVYKRTIRMTSLTSPMRVEEVRPEDIARLEDTCIDVINYASWMFALVKLIQLKSGPKLSESSIRVFASGRITPTAQLITDHRFCWSDETELDSCAYTLPTGDRCMKGSEAHAE